MDKQSSVYPTMEYDAAIKRAWGTKTCYNMDEPWKHYVKWNEPDTKEQIMYDSVYRNV